MTLQIDRIFARACRAIEIVLALGFLLAVCLKWGERTVVIAHEGEIPHSRKNTGGSPPGTTLQRGIARRWFVTQRESACPHV